MAGRGRERWRGCGVERLGGARGDCRGGRAMVGVCHWLSVAGVGRDARQPQRMRACGWLTGRPIISFSGEAVRMEGVSNHYDD